MCCLCSTVWNNLTLLVIDGPTLTDLEWSMGLLTDRLLVIPVSNPEEQDAGMTVADCTIHNVGHEYPGNCGITVLIFCISFPNSPGY